MGIIGGTSINVDQSGDNNVINLDINADINMNGFNIGSTGGIQINTNTSGIEQSTLFDTNGNIQFLGNGNGYNSYWITNSIGTGATSGQLDLFVNYDGGSLYGGELLINQDNVIITTNYGGNIWEFDNNGNLTLPTGVGNTTNIQTSYGITGTIDIIAYNNDVPGTEIILGNDILSLTSSNRANLITFDSNGVLNFDNTTTLNMNNNEIVNANTISNPSETIDIYNGTSVAKNGEIRLENNGVVITAGSSSGSLTFYNTGTLLLSDVGGIDCNGTNVYNTKNVYNNDTRSGYGYLNLIGGLNTAVNPNTENCSININETNIELNVNNKAVTTTLDTNGVLTLPTTTMNANAGLVYPDGTKQTRAYNPDESNLFTIFDWNLSQSGGSWQSIDWSTASTFNGSAVSNPTLSQYSLNFTRLNQYYLLTITYGGLMTTASFTPPVSLSQTGVLLQNGGAYVLGYASGQRAVFSASIPLNTPFSFPISCIVFSGTSAGGTISVQQYGDLISPTISASLTLIPLPWNQGSS